MQVEYPRVKLRDIEPDPNQPRKHFDEKALGELAHSISQYDVIEPVLLRPVKSKNKGKFMIVVGERRYRAAGMAGLADIPAIIKILSDVEALEVQITENLQRENVNPMEEAEAFKSIILDRKHYKTKELAARLGKRVEYINQRLKLCELIPEFQELVFADKILMSQANQICRFSAEVQKDFFQNYVPADWIEQPTGWKIREIHFGNTTHDLSAAPFKTEDPLLNPRMGACNNCKFNSFVSELPFEGQENKRICSNPSCYELKVKNNYQQTLTKAVENDDIVLVTDHVSGFLKAPEIASLTDKPILDNSEWEKLEKPNEDDPAFEEKLEEYEAKLPFAKKAFVIADYGNNEGKIIDVYVPDKNNSPTDLIPEQIRRLRSNEEDEQEKEEIRLMKNVKQVLEEDLTYANNERPLELKELEAIFILLYCSTSSQTAWSIATEWDNKHQITAARLIVEIRSTGRTSFMHKWIRRMLVEAICSNKFCDVSESQANAASLALYGIADRFVPSKFKNLLQEKANRLENRKKIMNDKIAALQQTEIEAL